MVLNALGRVHNQLGNTGEARRHFQRSVDAARRASGGKPSVLVANALTRMGQYARTDRRWAEGETYAREAVETYVAAGRGGTQLHAWALELLGEVLNRQRRFAEAVGVLEEADAINTKHLHPRHEQVSRTAITLGEAYEGAGRAADAERQL